VDLALCVITHRVERLRRGHLEVARAALEGGASMIQLREKNVTDRELWALAREMQRMARKRGAGFVVNDRVDIALAAEADGVHLGADDLPVAAARRILGTGAVVGASVANAEEAKAAEAAGATYVSVGSIFPTRGRDDRAPGQPQPQVTTSRRHRERTADQGQRQRRHISGRLESRRRDLTTEVCG